MTYPSKTPEGRRAYYRENRERICARRRAWYAQKPGRYKEYARLTRGNDEWRAVRRIKMQTWPSRTPESRHREYLKRRAKLKADTQVAVAECLVKKDHKESA